MGTITLHYDRIGEKSIKSMFPVRRPQFKGQSISILVQPISSGPVPGVMRKVLMVLRMMYLHRNCGTGQEVQF